MRYVNQQWIVAGGVDSRCMHAVWARLRGKISNAKTVYIVPDGALSRISFALLRQRDGSHLMDHYKCIFACDEP